ncbi:MAG: hypothetical protein SGI86_01580 [Deltaproteobacteria bacterium]|nr:hypothetical protein [Deltaproteobacteria bacterium]
MKDKLNANSNAPRYSNLAERASSIAAHLLGLGLFATCVVGCDRTRREAAPPPLADASVSASADTAIVPPISFTCRREIGGKRSTGPLSVHWSSSSNSATVVMTFALQ